MRLYLQWQEARRLVARLQAAGGRRWETLPQRTAGARSKLGTRSHLLSTPTMPLPVWWQHSQEARRLAARLQAAGGHRA
jgi:hypothetical protein